MCISVYADGPLTIELCQESLHPQFDDSSGKITTFLQCYDVVFRSHHDQPVDRLYVLHPGQLLPEPTVPLPDYARRKSIGAWQDNDAWTGGHVYPGAHTPHVDERTGACDLPVEYSPTGVGENALERLRVRVIEPRAIRIHPAFTEQSRHLFALDGGWPTPLVVELARPLPPAPPGEAEPRYLVRLAFRPPVVSPVAAERLPLPIETGKVLLKQTFKCRSAELIAEIFGSRLLRAAELGPQDLRAEAARLHRALITDGLRSPSRTVQVRSLRIGVITGERCFLLDSHNVGALGFLEVKRLPRDERRRHVHLWVGGADHYEEYDSVTLAVRMLEWFHSIGGVHNATLEDATIAIGSPSQDAVQAIASGLRSAGLIQSQGRAWKGTDSLFAVPKEDLGATPMQLRVRRAIAEASQSDHSPLVIRPPDLTFSLVTVVRE